MPVSAEVTRPISTTSLPYQEGMRGPLDYSYLASEVRCYAAEKRKSFDPLASVRMYRYDLYHFGQILPETHARVMDEEMSLMVEGVNRAARTEFALQRKGNDLAYYKNGEWKSYRKMLVDGKGVAEREAAADPRKQFLADAARFDLKHFESMLSLRPGEQYVWASPYCQDIEDKYGAEFVRSCGRFPDRKMGFLYQAKCEDNGTIVLLSQTLDGDNEKAITAALHYADSHPRATMDELVMAHDEVFGGRIYAGRADAKARENAWETLQKNRDLMNYFATGLEAIARRRERISDLEEVIKMHVYGTWAALKKRLDNPGLIPTYQAAYNGIPLAHLAHVAQEVQMAFEQFAAQGVPMVGCGGEIKMLQGMKDILDADPNTVFDAIFGKSDSGPDGLGPLVFKCKQGHTNHRKPGRLLTKCRVKTCAKGSVGCRKLSTVRNFTVWA